MMQTAIKPEVAKASVQSTDGLSDVSIVGVTDVGPFKLPVQLPPNTAYAKLETGRTAEEDVEFQDAVAFVGSTFSGTTVLSEQLTDRSGRKLGYLQKLQQASHLQSEAAAQDAMIDVLRRVVVGSSDAQAVVSMPTETVIHADRQYLCKLDEAGRFVCQLVPEASAASQPDEESFVAQATAAAVSTGYDADTSVPASTGAPASQDAEAGPMTSAVLAGLLRRIQLIEGYIGVWSDECAETLIIAISPTFSANFEQFHQASLEALDELGEESWVNIRCRTLRSDAEGPKGFTRVA